MAASNQPVSHTEGPPGAPLGRRLAHLWRRHGWLVIGLLWIVALILGFVGFDANARRAGRPDRFTDVAYRTLQLIPMGSGDPEGDVGWQLDVARFLIPFLAAWTAVRALLALFRDRWQQFLLRFWRDHVVICGLSRKGWLLAQRFAERGDRVVVIERDEDHDLIGPCGERGIVVLVGDATDPDLLRRAGLLRAGHLVAVTDDGANVEIAVRCQESLRRAGPAGRAYPLTCAVHLVDSQLYELARARELVLEEGAPFRLELWNVFQRGARLLWNAYRPGAALEAQAGATRQGHESGGGCSAHVLVVGLGCLGESLIAYAARDWHTRLHDTPCAGLGRLRITVIDLEAELKCRALGLVYPQLGEACDLVPLAMDVRGPDFVVGSFLEAGDDYPAASVVFVCFDDDSLGLRTGLALHRRLQQSSGRTAPVVVRMAEGSGLARLVASEGERPGPFAGLYAFGLLDETCQPEAILGGTHEILARSLHEVYVGRQSVLGHTAATNPALVPWEQLSDELRESNRAQAAGLCRHLGSLGYEVIPLTDWDAPFRQLSDPEVQCLAELEHDRWVAERKAKGWRYAGAPKDIEDHLSPAMVQWVDLPEAERDKVRTAAQGLPVTLARAGFQLVRSAQLPMSN